MTRTVLMSSLALLPLMAAGVEEKTAEASVSLASEELVVGQEIAVLLEVAPVKPFHVYYINPGEMGLPTRLEWQGLPEGVEAGELEFPVPHRIETGGLATFGYEEVTHFLTQLKASDEVKPGEYEVKAKISWLACDEDQCVPGGEEIALTLTIAEKAGEGEIHDFAEERAKLPKDTAEDWSVETVLSEDEGHWLITLTPSGEAGLAGEKIAVFTETESFLRPSDLPELSQQDGVISVKAKVSEYLSDLDFTEPATLVLATEKEALRFKILLPTKKIQE